MYRGKGITPIPLQVVKMGNLRVAMQIEAFIAMRL